MAEFSKSPELRAEIWNPTIYHKCYPSAVMQPQPLQP
jgi:hypothetical protein